MRIAVTGRNGQVALSLAERAHLAKGVDLITLARPELDLADTETIREALTSARPDVVISAAAYTAVDKAEDEPELAFAVNATGAGAVSAAAAELCIPVIHLSTDYVFDGAAPGEYTENDVPRPQSVYGASKLAGEKAVAEANPRHLILRTSWVYSPFGSNFVKTMLRLARELEEISVVADQCGKPTSALDIADAILLVSSSIQARAEPGLWGIYHLSGNGKTNWAAFARHIFTVSQSSGGPSARVREIATGDYPAKATRPRNSCLSMEKFTANFGWSPPDWQSSTKTVVSRLVGAGGITKSA